MNFPQYRSLLNQHSLYKILSYDHFIEYQKIGKYYLELETKALHYPEKLRIMDMLNNSGNQFKLHNQIEFEKILTYWETNLIKKSL